jgi:hypothetical protein
MKEKNSRVSTSFDSLESYGVVIQKSRKNRKKKQKKQKQQKQQKEQGQRFKKD